MFDVREVLLTELNTFSITGIQGYKDMEGTEIALADTEKIVFTSGMCAIGDLRIEREDMTFGQNRVTANVELVVMAKSISSVDAIDTMAESLTLNLDNNKFGRGDVLSTRVTNSDETIKLKESFYYKILTYEIVAIETAGANECPVPGTIELSPSLSSIEEEEITITATITEGTVFTADRYLWIFDFTNGATYPTRSIIIETATGSLTYDFSEPALGSAVQFGYEVIAIDSTNSKFITTGSQTGVTA